MSDRSEWIFKRNWEKINKRIAILEKKVYLLEDYKKKQCEKETVNLLKNKER